MSRQRRRERVVDRSLDRILADARDHRIQGFTPSRVILDELGDPIRRAIVIHQDCGRGRCTAKRSEGC